MSAWMVRIRGLSNTSMKFRKERRADEAATLLVSKLQKKGHPWLVEKFKRDGQSWVKVSDYSHVTLGVENN